MIYLDNAATTLPKPASVRTEMIRAIETMASPGRGTHEAAMRAADLVLDCRMEAAKLFHAAEPEQVVFTMNATHALNIAIRSLAGKGSRVLVSGFEHNAVTRPLHAIGAQIAVAGRKLFDTEDTLAAFEAKINEAELVICTHVSNVFGYILPINEIADLCRRKSIPLIVDASQSAGILELDMQKLGASFVAMPGHKALYGPQGTGILLCAEPGKPLLCGGSGSESIRQFMPEDLPDRLEAGTHNVPGIAGLLAGLRFVQKRGIRSIERHEKELLSHMINQLKTCDNLEVFAGPLGSQTGVLSVKSNSIPSERLASMLGSKGICVRAGLHCAPLAHQSAGTIEEGTVRFSFSAFNNMRQIDVACRTLREIK